MQPIDIDDQEAGFLRRHRIKLTVAALSAVGIALLVSFGGGSEKPFTPPPAPKIVNIVVPPPPPPPPPPKPREPRPETPREQQQMIAQETVTETEPTPDQAPSSDAPLGTGITGDGPADGFGLGTKAGGGGVFGGGTRAGGTGSRWGWYASQVQTSIQTALAAHPKTRSLALDSRVRIWLAADGSIERVEPARTASASERAALQEALVGLKLRQAAPADMPMPILMRVNLRRPS